MPHYGIIYKITDNRTGKVYIGQTIRSLKVRFLEHLNNPPNKYFKEAVNHYGDIKFNVIRISSNLLRTKGGQFTIEEILKTSNITEHNKVEIEQIKAYRSCVLDYYMIKNNKLVPLYGYNINRGGGGYTPLRGKLSPSYKKIDKKLLKKLIMQGFFLSEIARELEISTNTVEKKIKEFWNSQNISTLTESRIAFGGMELYRSRMSDIAQKSSPYYKEITNNQFIELIKRGFSVPEIQESLNISRGSIYLKLQNIGFDGISSARDHFGATETFEERYKQKHYNSVLSGTSHPDYIEVDEDLFKHLIEKGKDYKSIAEELSISERTVYDKSIELWGLTLPQAYRVFRIYPRIVENCLEFDDNYLVELLDGGLSIEEIDKEFLIKLIGSGYKKNDLINLYGFSHDWMTRWIQDNLNMDLYRAKDEYWWKPRIIYLFKIGYSARKMREISKSIIGKHVTHDIITRIWAKDYEIYGKDIFMKLKKRYS